MYNNNHLTRCIEDATASGFTGVLIHLLDGTLLEVVLKTRRFRQLDSKRRSMGKSAVSKEEAIVLMDEAMLRGAQTKAGASSAAVS